MKISEKKHLQRALLAVCFMAAEHEHKSVGALGQVHYMTPVVNLADAICKAAIAAFVDRDDIALHLHIHSHVMEVAGCRPVHVGDLHLAVIPTHIIPLILIKFKSSR